MNKEDDFIAVSARPEISVFFNGAGGISIRVIEIVNGRIEDDVISIPLEHCKAVSKHFSLVVKECL